MMAEPTNPNPQGVSIVIPAYNEEGGIGKVLAHLFEVMSSTSFRVHLWDSETSCCH
jgi:hypothetical protein